MNWFFYFRS